jgi:tetratricopeptide (TPR) repeat protein
MLYDDHGGLSVKQLGLLVLCAMALFGDPVRAESANDYHACVYQNDNPQARVAACTRLIEAGNQSPAISELFYNGRGIAYAKMNRNEDAVADFSKAIELQPRDANAHYDRGHALLALRRYDDALSDFSAAIEFNPSDEMSIGMLGNALRLKGQYDKAIQEYDAAIKLAPQDAVAFQNRGVAYSRKGEYDNAIADFGKAIQLKPNFANALNGRCWARAARGTEFEGALADCDAALRIDPIFAEARESRGLVLLRMGSFTDAIKAFSSALAQKPELPVALYGRGIAKLRLNDKTGGQSDIEGAEAILPSVSGEFARFGITP